MNVISGVKIHGRPLRQLVTKNGITYRRVIADTSKGTFNEFPSPQWEEKIAMEYMKCIPEKSAELEKEFLSIPGIQEFIA